MVEPVDHAPAFGIAERFIVMPAQRGHFGHVPVHPLDQFRLMLVPIFQKSRLDFGELRVVFG